MRISLEMKKGGKRVMEDNKSKLSIDLVTNTENLKKDLTGLSTMFHKIANAIDESELSEDNIIPCSWLIFL